MGYSARCDIGRKIVRWSLVVVVLHGIIVRGYIKTLQGLTGVNAWSIDRSPMPEPVSLGMYEKLFTYAHLIDIAYCVSNTNKIGVPFVCDLDCATSFPNMTLVYQWYFDDSVCGYIATTRYGLFGEHEQAGKKTIVVSLRGTRSIFDTLADLRVNMVEYSNQQIRLPPCEDCKIHKGFDEYFRNTLSNMHEVLKQELDDDDYELVFLGHSLGGSISLLLALHYLELGYENTTLVTMGQPLVGNINFAHWADEALSSLSDLQGERTSRKFLRVIHRDDIITTLPISDRLITHYHQFDNQIYINNSASTPTPLRHDVVDCVYGDNLNCIQKDFSGKIDLSQKNYLEIHNNYFRRMGLCGMNIRGGTFFDQEY